jgi:hypothetical protein
MSEETKVETVEVVAPVVTPVASVESLPVIGDVSEELGKELASGIAVQELERKENADPVEKEIPAEKAPEKKEEKSPEEKAPEKAPDKKESKKEEKTDEEVPVISDALLERAAKLGMKLVDAKGFQNAQALEGTLTLLEKQAESTSKAVEEIPDKKDEETLSDIPKLDPEKYDSEIIAVVEALGKKVTGLESENKSLRSSSDERSLRVEEEAATAAFDSSVNALGKDYEKILGVGNVNTLDESSPEFEARAKLAQRVIMVHNGYVSVGRSVSSEQVFAESVKAEFPDIKVGSVAEQAATAIASREEQITNPPGKTAGKVTASYEDDIAAELNAKFPSV